MELPELWNSVKSSMVLYILITSPNYSPNTPRNSQSDICLWIFVSKCCTFTWNAKYTFGRKDHSPPLDRGEIWGGAKLQEYKFHFLGLHQFPSLTKLFCFNPLSWTKCETRKVAGQLVFRTIWQFYNLNNWLFVHVPMFMFVCVGLYVYVFECARMCVCLCMCVCVCV